MKSLSLSDMPVILAITVYPGFKTDSLQSLDFANEWHYVIGCSGDPNKTQETMGWAATTTDGKNLTVEGETNNFAL